MVRAQGSLAEGKASREKGAKKPAEPPGGEDTVLKKEGVKRGKEEREQANTQQEKKTKTAGKRAGGEVKEEAKAGPEKYSMAEIKRLE
eukprot:2940166-Rhodomonas_salina.1